MERAENKAELLFACTARNNAGIDEKEYYVKVISKNCCFLY